MPDKTRDEKSTITSLSQAQIHQLRDAFQLIDQDSDGNISKEDLSKTYESIGQPKSDEEISEMFKNTEGITFTGYLSLLSNELSEIPNKNELAKAIKIYSEDMEIDVKELKTSLITAGMKESEIDQVLNKFKITRMNGDEVFIGKKFLDCITG